MNTKYPLIILLIIVSNFYVKAQTINGVSYSQLKTWLRADTLVTLNPDSTISTWQSISKGTVFAPPAPSQAPKISSNTNYVNGRAYASFKNSNQGLISQTPVSLNNNQTTVMLIAKFTDASYFGHVACYGTNGGGSWNLREVNATGRISFTNASINLGAGVNNSNSAQPGGNTTDLHLKNNFVVITANVTPSTGEWEILENFSSKHITNYAFAQISSNLLTIGYRADAGLFANFDMVELMIFDSTLSTNQLNVLTTYIQQKYTQPLSLGANVLIPSGFCDTVLSVPNYYHDYKWSNGINDTAKIKVNKTGTYILNAKNVFDFAVSDTVSVIYTDMPATLPITKTICPGSTFNYVTNLSHANYSFQWTNGSTDSLLNITNAGNYAVQITDNNGCKYTSDTTTFVIDAFPTYATLGVDTALCVGNSIQLKKGATQAVNYLWNTTDTTPSITITTGGQYTLQATNSNGCVVNDTINITLLGIAPTANFTYNNNCKGNNINCINTSVPPAGTTITANKWAINYAGITGSGINFNPVVNDTLTYVVSLKISSSNGCSNSVQKNIKVYNQPKVSITTLNSCTNDSTQLKALPTLQGNVFDYYQWTAPNATTITTSSNNIKQYISTSGNSTYTLQLFTTNGCSANATKSIYTYQAPNLAIDIQNNCANNTVICVDKTNYYGPYSVLNGTWSIQGIDTTNYSNYYFKKLPQGNYTITLTVQASNGCKGNYSKPLRVYALPIANYAVSNNCNGNNAIFNYVNTVPNAPIKLYSWTINSTNVYSGSSINYLINNTLDSLPISLTVIDTNNCKGTITNKIKIYTAPNATFTNDLSSNYDLPTTINFNNTSTNATQYTWYVNNLPVSTTTLNYTLNATTETNYNIKLIAKNLVQCADSITQVLELSKRVNDVMISTVTTTQNNNYAQVTCLLTNIGTRTLQHLQLYAQVAGNDAINETWAGNLLTGETVLYTFTSKLHINPLKKYNDAVCVWATQPNNFDNSNMSNNRACAALSTTTDFKLSTIYQNPENKSILITVLTKTPTIAHLTINDLSGKIIIDNTNLNLTQPYNEVFIDLTKFASGIYKYSIDNGTQQLTGSFYVQ